VGNNKKRRPGFFDVAGGAKWDAWKAESGKGKEEVNKFHPLLVFSPL
jgi:acyl-CoA-binding protein